MSSFIRRVYRDKLLNGSGEWLIVHVEDRDFLRSKNREVFIRKITDPGANSCVFCRLAIGRNYFSQFPHLHSVVSIACVSHTLPEGSSSCTVSSTITRRYGVRAGTFALDEFRCVLFGFWPPQGLVRRSRRPMVRRLLGRRLRAAVDQKKWTNIQNLCQTCYPGAGGLTNVFRKAKLHLGA